MCAAHVPVSDEQTVLGSAPMPAHTPASPGWIQQALVAVPSPPCTPAASSKSQQMFWNAPSLPDDTGTVTGTGAS
jgi:hypothetical protein